MPKLEVKEHKKLVLKNVLKKELRNINMEQVDQEILKFTQRIDLLKVQAFGPLVIHNIGTNISEDGTLTMDYDLLVQAYDYLQYKHEFVTIERFSCDHCLYLHFEGSPEEVTYANTKLDLYCYENDLSSSGELYTVCIQENEHYVVMDFFQPVV